MLKSISNFRSRVTSNTSANNHLISRCIVLHFKPSQRAKIVSLHEVWQNLQSVCSRWKTVALIEFLKPIRIIKGCPKASKAYWWTWIFFTRLKKLISNQVSCRRLEKASFLLFIFLRSLNGHLIGNSGCDRSHVFLQCFIEEVGHLA